MGLSYLVVTTDMFFFTFETKSSDWKGIWRKGGGPFFWRGEGDSEEKLFGEAQQENMTQMHVLGISGVIWGNLGTFWSDLI